MVGEIATGHRTAERVAVQLVAIGVRSGKRTDRRELSYLRTTKSSQKEARLGFSIGGVVVAVSHFNSCIQLAAISIIAPMSRTGQATPKLTLSVIVSANPAKGFPEVLDSLLPSRSQF